MSHDIDMSTGKPAIAYVGQTPWHGLGERLPEGKSIEEWVNAAGLNWEIQMLPVLYPFNGQNRIMDNRFVLARDDIGTALSIVSRDYQIVQPAEVLEFYRDLVAHRGYTLETAGALDEGRKVWALARTGLVADISDDPADKLGAYVLLATSCDKSLATTATFTSIRVVCQNTLAFATDDMRQNKRRSIKVDHSRKFDPKFIENELGLIDHAWEDLLKRINLMADCKLDTKGGLSYFESLFLSDDERKKKQSLSRIKQNEVIQLASLYGSAKGQDLASAKGTLWGAVNAVTYYVDHVRRTSAGQQRLDNAWFGSGAQLKDKAWDRALEFVA